MRISDWSSDVCSSDLYEPHHRPGKVVPESAAMRQDEVGLKFRQPLVRDAGLGEEAEAGVDAVNGAPRFDDPLDACLRGVDRIECGPFQRDRRTVPDGAQFLQDRKSTRLNSSH